jgi:hypothetical protein
VTLGLGLLGLGVATTLANLGRIDLLSTLRQSWPVLLIVWGVLELWLTFSSRRAA